MLADMEIGGKLRKVLMQAPKNGFFYVIDRETGKFISAKPYVTVNWATGIDPATGRPIENPATRVDKTGQPALVTPGALGGHNWHPMAFSPKEKLVYIPAFEAGMMYAPEANWKPDRNRGFNVGFNLARATCPPMAASASRWPEACAGCWWHGIRWRRRPAGRSSTPAPGTAGCWRPAAASCSRHRGQRVQRL